MQFLIPSQLLKVCHPQWLKPVWHTALCGWTSSHIHQRCYGLRENAWFNLGLVLASRVFKQYVRLRRCSLAPWGSPWLPNDTEARRNGQSSGSHSHKQGRLGSMRWYLSNCCILLLCYMPDRTIVIYYCYILLLLWAYYCFACVNLNDSTCICPGHRGHSAQIKASLSTWSVGESSPTTHDD